jgi:hypothetical protein
MNHKKILIIILIASLGFAVLISPVGAFPSQSSVNSISIQTILPESPANVTLYRVNLLPNDMIDYSVTNAIEIRQNVTSESDAPLIAQNALIAYGGLPSDAVRVYDKTINAYRYNATTNEIKAVYPIMTEVQYTRYLDGKPVIGQGGHISVSLGDNGELLELYKVWRTVRNSGSVTIIPVISATKKLNQGAVLYKSREISIFFKSGLFNS